MRRSRNKMCIRDRVGRKFWNLLFIFTMYFGGGLVPYYMVLKGIHMLNTFWVFIFPLMMSCLLYTSRCV